MTSHEHDPAHEDGQPQEPLDLGALRDAFHGLPTPDATPPARRKRCPDAGHRRLDGRSLGRTAGARRPGSEAQRQGATSPLAQTPSRQPPENSIVSRALDAARRGSSRLRRPGSRTELGFFHSACG